MELKTRLEVVTELGEQLETIKKFPSMYVRLLVPGGQYHRLKIKEYYSYRYGMGFKYKLPRRKNPYKWGYVFTPQGYQFPIEDGHVTIPQTEGSLTPSSTEGFIITMNDEYKLLLNTHLEADKLRTLHGGTNIPWKIIIIVAIIAIVVFVGLHFITGGSSSKTSGNAVPITPIPASGTQK